MRKRKRGARTIPNSERMAWLLLAAKIVWDLIVRFTGWPLT